MPIHRYRVPGTGTWYQVLGYVCTRYQVPGTWYQVPCTWYQAPGTWYLVPGTRYQGPGIRYQVPGTRYKVSGTRRQIVTNPDDPLKGPLIARRVDGQGAIIWANGSPEVAAADGGAPPPIIACIGFTADLLLLRPAQGPFRFTNRQVGSEVQIQPAEAFPGTVIKHWNQS